MRASFVPPALVFGILACAADAPAQELRIPAVPAEAGGRILAAPQLAAPNISLSEAVQQTVRADATIAIGREDVSAASGRLRETRSPFDPLLGVRTTFGWNHTPLVPFLRSREERKRLQLQTLRDQFGFIDSELRKSLASLNPRPPVCPVGFDFTISSGRVPSINIDRRDATEKNILGVQRDLSNSVTGSIMSGFTGAQLSTVCTPPAKIGLPQDLIRSFWGNADTLTNGALGLNPFLANTQQFPNELIGAQQQLAYTISTRAGLGLARVGGVPTDEVHRDVAYEANWDKLLRNGWSYGAQLRLLSNQHTFVDKPLDPSFGGAEDSILFPSSVTLEATVPIGRGSGRRSVEAPEKAAELNLRAENARVRHTISESTFRTVLAYLRLVASQERLRYLQESAARQQQMLESTQLLVNGGELPRSDLDRARARSADTASAVADAQLASIEARVSLADAMGVDVARVDNLPLSQGRFADSLPAIPDVGTLMAAALTNRRDRRALQLIQQAAGIMVTAANADLRHLFDMNVSGGMANTYDNFLFRYLPDELYPLFTNLPRPEVKVPTKPPALFSSVRGFGRSLSGRWEPFFAVSFSYELPYVNNRYRGRALQAEASLKRSTIESADIDRVIRDNVTRGALSLQSAAQTIERRRAAIALQRTTVDGALQRLRAGDLSLFDTLATEDDLTREETELVENLLTYFSTLARLRFETGQLIAIEGEGTTGETLIFSGREFITP